MNPQEPVLDRFDRLIRLGEQLLVALGRLEAKLGQARPDADASREDLWTADEAAAFLKCSKSKVYQHAAAGKLPNLHVGGQLRFEPEAVRRWTRGEPIAGAVVQIGRRP